MLALNNIPLKLTFELGTDTVVTTILGAILGIDKFYVGVQAFIYGVFMTNATSLASASASQFPFGLGLGLTLSWPR